MNHEGHNVRLQNLALMLDPAIALSLATGPFPAASGPYGLGFQARDQRWSDVDD